MAGLEACLGADMIVNTDADNQYCAEDIPKLIKPILLGRAEIVIGARPIWATEHFSQAKAAAKPSWVVRLASNTNIPDAPVAFAPSVAMQRCRWMYLMNTLTPWKWLFRLGKRDGDYPVPIRTNGIYDLALSQSIPAYSALDLPSCAFSCSTNRCGSSCS